jgi:hypothetical protein
MHIHVYVHICTGVGDTLMYIYIYICIYIYIHMCVCVCVCVHFIYTHTHTHTHTYPSIHRCGRYLTWQQSMDGQQMLLSHAFAPSSSSTTAGPRTRALLQGTKLTYSHVVGRGGGTIFLYTLTYFL